MGIGALASVLLLLILQTSAAAEIYRCQTSDGRVVLTDKPLNLSDDCKQIKENTSKEAYSGPSTDKRPPPQKEVSKSKQTPSDQPAAKPASGSWVSRASILVENYKVALKNRFHESNIFDKQKAIREIEKIKHEKASFLEELEKSSLHREERVEAKKILEEIPP